MERIVPAAGCSGSGLALLQRILRVGQGLGGGIDISLRQAGVKEGLLGRLGCGERILECLPAGLGVSRAIGAELVGRFNRAIKRRRIGISMDTPSSVG